MAAPSRRSNLAQKQHRYEYCRRFVCISHIEPQGRPPQPATSSPRGRRQQRRRPLWLWPPSSWIIDVSLKLPILAGWANHDSVIYDQMIMIPWQCETGHIEPGVVVDLSACTPQRALYKKRVDREMLNESRHSPSNTLPCSYRYGQTFGED